jgi:purine-binding chemotaxis protein CheW
MQPTGGRTHPVTNRTSSKNLPFVLFQVKDGLYALGSERVREIVMLPKVIAVPNVPPEIRGVINLRGKIIRLMDLRVMLGLPSAKTEVEELIQLLHEREQDHLNWLTELESCVRERRPFKMARDPHLCKFGVWYHKFKTDNTLLKMALKKMEKPHAIIHASAADILLMAERGDMDGAQALLAARRNRELVELVKLFNEVRRLLREHHRELAIVVESGEKRFAFSIDQVEAVERIPEESIEPMSEALVGRNENLKWRLGKRGKTNQTILLLDEDFFVIPGAEN